MTPEPPDHESDPTTIDCFADAATLWHGDTERLSRTAEARSAAQERLDALAKPPGSLGALEDLAVRLVGIAGVCPPPVPRPASVAVFAADHGVHAAGVTPWPQEITALMAGTMAGGRATINAFAGVVGAQVTVVDVGIATGDSISGVTDARIRRGTRNLATEEAMTIDEAVAALDLGARTAADLVAQGCRCLVTGEMGIANTTAATALICFLLEQPPGELAGPGAGADAATVIHKAQVIQQALARHHRDDDPLDVLASLGGLEIAAMAGFVVAGASLGIPVLVDGVIANAALLAAESLVPGVSDGAVAGHRSSEPAAAAVLETLGLDAVLDLSMHLGEGSGAVLALPILEAAARLFSDVATIAELTGDSD